MKAVIQEQYGGPGVLELKEVEKPKQGAGELLIKIHAASVTAADTMMRKGVPAFGRVFLGLARPKNPVPGTGFAGIVEAVDKEVKGFSIGDEVFGETVFGSGTYAEYTCVPETGVLAVKPGNLSFEEAAPVCDGALTSLNFLRELAKIKPGQSVLVNGAAGSLGTAAVQLAKHLGAEVTAVCSTTNLDLVKAIGAAKVIDYTSEEFCNSDQAYDVIYDTVGKSSFGQCKGSLTPSGIYLSPVLNLPILLQMIWTSLVGGKKAMFSATGMLPATKLRVLLSELVVLLAEGKLSTVIDRCYPLEQVIEAHEYVDLGHKKGNVVITMVPPGNG